MKRKNTAEGMLIWGFEKKKKAKLKSSVPQSIGKSRKIDCGFLFSWNNYYEIHKF